MLCFFFFFKQKTAYEMRISDWSSDVCSSDLNLREMRRQWSHATALTPALVDARSRATAACEMIWRKARADSDFKAFAKAFRPVLDLTREVAAANADAFGLSPYDALLDEYEPRSEERRVGHECVSKGRSRVWPYP